MVRSWGIGPTLSFDDVADAHDAIRPSYPAASFGALFEMLPSHPTIVELGPGTGRTTRDLLVRGAAVHAIEIGPSMAATLRSNLPSDHLRVTVGEVLEEDDRVDAVTVRSCDRNQTYTTSPCRQLVLSSPGTQMTDERDRSGLVDTWRASSTSTSPDPSPDPSSSRRPRRSSPGRWADGELIRSAEVPARPGSVARGRPMEVTDGIVGAPGPDSGRSADALRPNRVVAVVGMRLTALGVDGALRFVSGSFRSSALDIIE